MKSIISLNTILVDPLFDYYITEKYHHLIGNLIDPTDNDVIREQVKIDLLTHPKYQIISSIASKTYSTYPDGLSEADFENFITTIQE